jgi:FkbM family methyltransferase
MHKLNRTLFRHTNPVQYNLIESIKFDISKRVLTRLYKQHIADGRRQLAVFSFDAIGLDIAYFGVYEKKELDCFFLWIDFLRDDFKQAAVLDIGANIGNHSLYFSDYFKQVCAFEPNLRTYGLLSFNAGLVDNIRTFNYGLSDHAGKAELATESKNIGASKILHENNIQLQPEATTRKQTIDLKVLDDLSITDLTIKLIKIDVEGHELEALSGAKRTLLEHQPIVIFEQLKHEFSAGSTPCIELLRSYGYQYFAVADFGPKPNIFWPKCMRKFIQKVMVTFKGKQACINLVTSFEAKTYPFVIAIPNWLALKLSLS